MHYPWGFLVAVWAFYLMGQFFAVLMKAYGVIESDLNALSSYGAFFKHYWAPTLGRTFVSILVMVWWLEHPDAVNVAATFYVEKQPSLESLIRILGPHTFGLEPTTAGAAGFMYSDVVDRASPFLAKIPGFRLLQAKLPPPSVNPPKG